MNTMPPDQCGVTDNLPARGLEEADLLRYRINEGAPLAFSSDSVLHLPKGSWLRVDLASGGCWYGHGFAHRQPYPLNAEPIVNSRFSVNNIQSPIWMCSAGFALLIETTAELAVRSNSSGNGQLELSSDQADVTVRVFRGSTLPEAHGKLMRHLQWPPPVPESRLFGDSIFCTWTQYPRAITQQRILAMAREIRAHGFPCSLITIDDRWESTFGELSFSRDFPEPRQMVEELHEMGFRVLLWVTPFVNVESATFPYLSERVYLAREKGGKEASLFKWWGGTAGLVDLTNPEARHWYRSQLLRLKEEIGIDGFKIDGGDAKYQPDPEKTAWHQYAGPSGYVDLLLELFEEIAPGQCESRTAWLSPKRNILWREGGKDSHWGVDNGLRAMVHLGLHLSLLGYDLLIPDMIPGRIQTLISSMPLPSDELFVRWTEASTFMPIMQFSYFPWNYSEATSEIARRYALLHKGLEAYLAEQARARKSPLLRPLWYDHPEIPALYSCGDQFQLGADLLVSPVMNENQVARDILLPPGDWRDAWTGQVHSEGQLFQYPAPCPGIPVFVRAERAELFAIVHAGLKAIARGSIEAGKTTATYSCGLDREIAVTG